MAMPVQPRPSGSMHLYAAVMVNGASRPIIPNRDAACLGFARQDVRGTAQEGVGCFSHGF
jgi:hypothetical protein